MRIKEKRKELDPQIIQIVQVSAGIVKIYNYSWRLNHVFLCVFELHGSTDMWIFLIANTNTTWSVAGWTCRCGGTRYRGPHISSTQINPCIVQGSTVVLILRLLFLGSFSCSYKYSLGSEQATVGSHCTYELGWKYTWKKMIEPPGEQVTVTSSNHPECDGFLKLWIAF